jgi:hypothetical protein
MHPIEMIDHLSEMMTPTSLPKDHALKSLCHEGAKHGLGQDMVQNQRKINTSAANMTRLWRRAKGHGRQHQGLDSMILCCLFCGSQQQRLSKPGLTIDGEMRALPFGTTGRDDREPTEPGAFTNLSRGQIAKASALCSHLKHALSLSSASIIAFCKSIFRPLPPV